ncbi:MAG: tRNA lysidine(34) synthetase TilS [Bacteroidetes bacterium]|nr:tRNA lysidine(34) synthetase TilS [Bacteroidota bacterium]
MIRLFESFIKKNKLLLKTDRILLAVSGGIDSVVMTDLFYKAGYTFGIAHCNFGLRGKESDAEEDFTRILAKKFKVPFYTKQFKTAEYAVERKISVQMAARDLRYTWFEELRSSGKFDCIATAHHLDDQVETFMINLIRGTGISGLHGILRKQGYIIRPMLFAFRKDIENYAKEYHISFMQDSSNLEDKYIRNKIRRKIIPQLEELNPDFKKTITSEIKILKAWQEIGEKEIKRKTGSIVKKQNGKTIIDINALKNTSPCELYAWEIFSYFGFNSSVVADILANLDGKSGTTFLSPTHRAVKDRDSMIIQPVQCRKDATVRLISERTKSILSPVKLRLSVLENRKDTILPAGKEYASLDFDKLTFPLEIRKWQPGDSFHPFGMNGKKKVSDLLINEKISLPDKENTRVLCSSGKIAWVIGLRIDQRFRITSKTLRIFRIVML